MDLIQLAQGTNRVVLQGAGMGAPFRGAVLRPGYGDGDEVSGEVDVSLGGTPGEIESGLGQVGRLLAEAERVRDLPGAEGVYLEARATVGGEVWRSRILGGHVALLGGGAGQRAGGSQGARLVLRRANWWESAAVKNLRLSNTGSGGQMVNLPITNHWDAATGHCNYAELSAEDAGGELPAPVIATVDYAAGQVAELFAGVNVFADPASMVEVFEGENGGTGPGVTETVVNNAEHSNSASKRLNWNSAGPQVVWYATLDGALHLQRMAGRAFLPLLKRTQPSSSPGGCTLWYHWQISAVSGIILEPLMKTLKRSLNLQPLLSESTPLYLPPWPAATGAPETMRLELVVEAETDGACQVDVDYLYLLPLDAWRVYRPAVRNYGDLAVYDDPYRGVMATPYSSMQVFVGEGPGLWMWPGRRQRFYFVAGGNHPAGLTGQVTLQYHPRKRTL